MKKKITSSIKKFIWQLYKLPMTEEFKGKIDRIIYSCWNKAEVKQNTLIIIISSKETYTVSMKNDKIEYHTYYTIGEDWDNRTIEEAGEIYKCGRNLITKHLESTINTKYDYQEITTKTTISCFNDELVEIFKSITKDYKNYNAETGKKKLIEYEDRGYPLDDCNALKTTKIRRTHNGNLIRTDEIRHYIDSQKKYDSKSYSIKRSNETYITSTTSEYTPIEEELYMNYINFKITESELLKKYVKKRNKS